MIIVWPDKWLARGDLFVAKCWVDIRLTLNFPVLVMPTILLAAVLHVFIFGIIFSSLEYYIEPIAQTRRGLFIFSI